MNTNKPIYQLHEEHKEWLNKLSFYEDEIALMQKHLAEVNFKNSAHNTRALVEHFQNQFIIHKEQIDIFRHEINQQEAILNTSVMENPTAVDHRKATDLVELRERFNVFENVFKDLKREHTSFIAKWM